MDIAHALASLGSQLDLLEENHAAGGFATKRDISRLKARIARVRKVQDRLAREAREAHDFADALDRDVRCRG